MARARRLLRDGAATGAANLGDIPTLPETVVEAEPPRTAEQIANSDVSGAQSFFPANSFDAFTSPGRAKIQLGTLGSASQGTYGRADIQYRPSASRRGLELVPGLSPRSTTGAGRPISISSAASISTRHRLRREHRRRSMNLRPTRTVRGIST